MHFIETFEWLKNGIDWCLDGVFNRGESYFLWYYNVKVDFKYGVLRPSFNFIDCIGPRKYFRNILV